MPVSSATRKDDAVAEFVACGARIEGGAAPAFVVLEVNVHLSKRFRIKPLQPALFVLFFNGLIYVIETVDVIAERRAEGCVVVEMEAAGMMAVAQFRDILFGQVLYAGDDLSGTEWDRRDWQSLSDVRESLFWLCVDAVLTT